MEACWRRGLIDFNKQRFWEAHAAWELVWRDLSGSERHYVQALIQLCGVFFLLSKSRNDAARRLSQRALFHFNLAGIDCNPVLEIPGARELLLEIERRLTQGSEIDEEVKLRINGLRAHWRG